MAIPNTQTIMLPLLRLMGDESTRKPKEMVDSLAEILGLTDEEKRELTPGGSKAKFYSRVTGARSYLTHAGLLESPKRGTSRITEEGLAVLANPPEVLDLEFLLRFPKFVEWLQTSRSAQRDPALRRLLETLKEQIDNTEEQAVEPDEVIIPSQDNKVVAELQVLDPMATISFWNQNQPVTQRGNLDETYRDEETNVNLFYLIALRLLESYFIHRWLYLLPIVLMLCAGVVAQFLAEPEFLSRGVVSVKRDTLVEVVSDIRTQGGFGYRTPAQVTNDEISELRQTDAFIVKVISQTMLQEAMDDGPFVVNQTIVEVRDSLSSRATGPNQVQITARHENPLIAQQLAGATMDSFLEWQIGSNQQDTATAISYLQELVPEYEAEYSLSVEALEGYLLQNPEPIRGNRPELETLQITRLQAAVSLADTQYKTAVNDLEALLLEQALAEGKIRQTYTIVDAPILPLEPEGGLVDIIVGIGIFLAAGIVLTVVGILGSALLDRTMRFPIDARYSTGLPVLASVSRPKPIRRRLRARGQRTLRKAAIPEDTKAIDSSPDSQDTNPAPAT